jgi:hypothetical protein
MILADIGYEVAVLVAGTLTLDAEEVRRKVLDPTRRELWAQAMRAAGLADDVPASPDEWLGLANEVAGEMVNAARKLRECFDMDEAESAPELASSVALLRAMFTDAVAAQQRRRGATTA